MIENKLKESPFIEQIIVLGENQKFAAALIVPSFMHVKSYCEAKGIEYLSDEDIIKNPLIVKRIEKEVNILNKSFGESEQIVRFELIHEPWTTLGGELTPTLKLKRNVIIRKHEHQIAQLFEARKR
jgi:long-chain acyl-CoA synthetase